MGLLVHLKDTMDNIADAGRSKAAGVRQARERARLLRELGEARYAQSKGVVTSEAEIDRIIGELDALDRTAENGEDSEPEPS